MKFGTFLAGEAKFAQSSAQVADHSHLTAYSTVECEAETVAIGQLIETAAGHFINAYTGGQQTGGLTTRHGAGASLVPTTGTFLQTSLARSGETCEQLVEGDWSHQERSSDIIPAYRYLVFSVHARKPSASNGTLALGWTYTLGSLTVTAATTTTVTDSSKSWTPDEWIGKTFYVRESAVAKYQMRTVTSNTSDALTFGTRFGTPPAVGDTGVILETWTSPQMYRIDRKTGAVVASGTVRSYAGWERFYVCLRIPAAFDYAYFRVRSSSGTFLWDDVKIEMAEELEEGISTAASATTLTDTNRGRVEDEDIGRQLLILSGDDIGDCQTITDNTQTVWTVAAFATTPSTTSTYVIVPPVTDMRPSVFLDIGNVSQALYDLSAYNINAGVLRIGGLSDRPRLIVADANDQTVITMGSNLDGTDFRGMVLERGVGIVMKEGVFLSRKDGGISDTGQRLRITYEGMETYDANDVRTAGFFSDGEFDMMMGDSSLQERIVINRSKGIAAIDHQDRIYWIANPVTKEWRVGYKDAANRYAEFTPDTGYQIHGEALIDGTLTATKIIVADLDEFGASVGGWELSSTAIYTTNTLLHSSGYASFGPTPPTAYGNNVGAWLGYDSAAKMSLYADASNYLQWDGTKLLWKGANTALDASGNLTATSATITGTIDANAGYIGTLTVDGALTVGTAGDIRAGATGYRTGTGFWMGYHVSAYKFHIGSSDGLLYWDGTKLATTGMWVEGGLAVGTAGHFKCGATAYNTGTGWWMEYNAGTPRIFIGNAAGNKLLWTGTALELTGTVTATAGVVGGWTLAATTLSSGDITLDAGNERIYLSSQYIYWNAGGTYIGFSGAIGVTGAIYAASLSVTSGPAITSSAILMGAKPVLFSEMTAPGAPSANNAYLFCQDNGAGKTQLCARFNTGAIQVLATEP